MSANIYSGAGTVTNHHGKLVQVSVAPSN